MHLRHLPKQNQGLLPQLSRLMWTLHALLLILHVSSRVHWVQFRLFPIKLEVQEPMQRQKLLVLRERNQFVQRLLVWLLPAREFVQPMSWEQRAVLWQPRTCDFVSAQLLLNRHHQLFLRDFSSRNRAFRYFINLSHQLSSRLLFKCGSLQQMRSQLSNLLLHPVHSSVIQLHPLQQCDHSHISVQIQPVFLIRRLYSDLVLLRMSK